MIKRKQISSPTSFLPSKRQTRAESPIPLGPDGKPLEIVPGKGEQISKQPEVMRQKLGQPHSSVFAVVKGDQNVESQFDMEREAVPPNASSAVELENISQSRPQAVPCAIADAVTECKTDEERTPGKRATIGAAASTANPESSAISVPPQRIQKHRVPTHAGWFSWGKVHMLERRGVPEFFNGKSKTKTHTLYLEYRNFLIQKYLENPQRILSISDVQDQVVGDLNAVRHVLEFLDHWGLINYQAPSGSRERTAWQRIPEKLLENEGELQAVSQAAPPLTALYRFDKIEVPNSSIPEALGSGAPPADAVASEVLNLTQGQAVEYHCNSCSADCSKRRYHCQKQADFDLCPDCYSDGKFGNGMSTAHFIRMDAVSETDSGDGGGWTEQETLLLLEALELYGDNWNDIAEHVGTKSKDQCILHFIQMPIEDSFLEDMETPSSTGAGSTMLLQVGENPETSKASTLTPPLPEQATEVAKEGKNSSLNEKQAQQEESVAKAITAASALVEGPSTDGLVAFADSANPVMSQVAFLAAMVGPRVAAAAAQSALMSLSDEEPAASLAARNTIVLDIPMPDKNLPRVLREGSQSGDKNSMAEIAENNSAEFHSANQQNESGDDFRKPSAGNDLNFLEVEEPPSVDKVRIAAATALGAAAVKAKLLADQEEREIQRLVAIVIENQLKKLELKLKHFGELEVMLKDECDQVERARQKQFAERARLVSSRFGSPPHAPPQAQAPGLTSLNNRLTVPSSATTTSLQTSQPSGTASTGLNRPAGFTFGPRGPTPIIPMPTPRPSGPGQSIVQQGPVAGSQGHQSMPL